MGSTRFCTCGLPEPEQIVLEQARKIAISKIPYEESTEAQKHIMREAMHLLGFRFTDLMLQYLEDRYCQDDGIARITLHERFLWFFQEIRKELQQQLEVSEIERTNPPTEEHDTVDEYFRKAPECFTQGSYEKLQDDSIRDMVEKGYLKI